MKISELFNFENASVDADGVSSELQRMALELGAVSGGNADLDFELPPIEKWVDDPYYIGDWALPHERGGLYPALRQSIIDAWRPEVTEVILAGSAGSGKSNRA